MSATDVGHEPLKTNRAWTPPNKRYDFPARSSINRYFTVWSWQDGPIEIDRKCPNRKYFWETLHSNAPATASPYCCYINTVIFYKSEQNHEEICREDTYGFSGASPTILTDPTAQDDRRFYEVFTGSVVYRDGRWWMRWTAWSNTRIARMLNAGWPHQ